jgi:hypothetical protein
MPTIANPYTEEELLLIAQREEEEKAKAAQIMEEKAAHLRSQMENGKAIQENDGPVMTLTFGYIESQILEHVIVKAFPELAVNDNEAVVNAATELVKAITNSARAFRKEVQARNQS